MKTLKALIAAKKSQFPSRTGRSFVGGKALVVLGVAEAAAGRSKNTRRASAALRETWTQLGLADLAARPQSCDVGDRIAPVIDPYS